MSNEIELQYKIKFVADAAEYAKVISDMQKIEEKAKQESSASKKEKAAAEKQRREELAKIKAEEKELRKKELEKIKEEKAALKKAEADRLKEEKENLKKALTEQAQLKKAELEKEKAENAEIRKAELAQIKAEQAELKKAKEELEKSKPGTSKENSKEELETKIKLQRETAKLRKEIVLETRANADNASAYDRLSAQLTINQAKVKDLLASKKELTDADKKLIEETQDLDKELKAIDKTVGQNTRTVGDYEGSILSAANKLKIYGVSLEDVKKGYEDSIKEIKIMKSSILGFGDGLTTTGKALKIFKLALISTGIGALIVGVGVLVAYFTKTQEGIDKIKQSTAFLSGMFDRFTTDILAPMGKTLFAVFEDPKQAMLDLVDFIKNNMINRFKALSVIFQALKDRDAVGLRHGIQQLATGVVDLEKKTENLGKSIVAAGKSIIEGGNAATKAEKQLQALARAEVALLVPQQKLRTEIAKMKESIEDENLTNAEKIKIIDDIIKKENELENSRIGFEKRKLKQMQQEADVATNLLEADKAIEEQKAKVLEMEEEGARRRKEITTKRLGLVNAENKELQDVAMKGIDEIDAMINEDIENQQKYFSDERIRIAKNEQEELYSLTEKRLLSESQLIEIQNQQRLNVQRKLAGELSGLLEQVFGKSKLLASANVVLSTIQAVMRANADYPFPISLGVQALQIAAGAKALKDINSTKIGSSSVSSSASSSSNAPRTGYSSPISNTIAPDFSSGKVTKQNVILNVNNKIDREGLSIAVREGSDSLNSRSINTYSD